MKRSHRTARACADVCPRTIKVLHNSCDTCTCVTTIKSYLNMHMQITLAINYSLLTINYTLPDQLHLMLNSTSGEKRDYKTNNCIM